MGEEVGVGGVETVTRLDGAVAGYYTEPGVTGEVVVLIDRIRKMYFPGRDYRR